MRLPFSLALLFLSALPSRADEAPPLPKGQPQEARPEPAPQLMHLERTLMQKQEARDKGTLSPEKYQEFVAQFRAELDAVMGRITPTPENKALHAQILARLGEQERGQAVASLDQALVEDPENPALLVAKGSILHEKKDYPAAAALAQQVWEASGRTNKRAWALLKMSEGRTAGGRTGEPAPRLQPAADFARLEWSIPENNDINPRAMGFIQQAIAARRNGDMPSTQRNAQAAMNADPTSAGVQKLYGIVQADQSKHADTLAYVGQAVESMHAGRGPEAIAWAQKAYDRSPGDDTYSVLQDVRRRSAELDAKHAEEPAKTPKGSSPVLPLALLAGGSLAAYGLFQVVKSKNTRTADDGLDPAPHVSPEQTRRNYANSAVLIGTPVVIFTLVYGGPTAWRATASVVGVALRGGRESVQKLATSEAGAILPGEIRAAETTIRNPESALQGAQLKEHLRQVAIYGKAGARHLQNGKIRYYSVVKPAEKPGEMAGRRLVREWDPITWTQRTWHETLDHAGHIRSVRPETGGSKMHYVFDPAGKYVETR